MQEPIRSVAGAFVCCLRFASNYRTAIVFMTIAARLTFADEPTRADDKPPSDHRTVHLRFLGADKNTPLPGLHVEVTSGHGSDQKKFGPFKTDDTGTADVKLPLGFYSLHLQADKQLPYLPVEVVWNKRSRTTRPDLSLAVTKSGVEKWLDGKRREDDYEPPTKPGGAPRITYTLLKACELTLRAVDADTGQGLQGAEFYTENALGEYWAHPIENQTIPVKPNDDVVKPAKDATSTKLQAELTDEKGHFRRLVSANANYTYGVTKAPKGYVQMGPAAEVEIQILYGQRTATHTFKFRKAE